TRPQGVAPRPGLPPARVTAGRSGRQQGQLPRKAVPPGREVPPEGTSVTAYAVQRRHRRRRWGKRARASF
ncbi:hypothetical protein B296_00009557, partial [Ensete ventricosum]